MSPALKDELELRTFTEPHWFRVEARHWSVADEWGEHSYTSADLVVRRILVLRHTPKGAWLGPGPGQMGEPKRLVMRDYFHRGRAYAAPTLAQAREDFRKRKQYRISCLQHQINIAQREIDLLDRGELRSL